jgi:hypothetical protein
MKCVLGNESVLEETHARDGVGSPRSDRQDTALTCIQSVRHYPFKLVGHGPLVQLLIHRSQLLYYMQPFVISFSIINKSPNLTGLASTT